jgi:16S rRNA (guanine527-N7)-methyltransferase
MERGTPAEAAVVELPEVPEAARAVFGDRFDDAVRYAELLATAGVQRGLIGPREVPRLWERHLLNCAVLAEVVPDEASLCDVGSGAGLPGIPVALARPDLSVMLLEPLLRRTTFLEEVVKQLGLTNVTVLRGRAEEMIGRLSVDVVTARAVAPLERLAGWGLPLLRPYGEMLALKGDSAEQELHAARAALAKLGAVEWSVVRAGSGTVETPTHVVRVQVGESPGGVRAAARRAKAARAGRASSGGRGAPGGRGAGRRRR